MSAVVSAMRVMRTMLPWYLLSRSRYDCMLMRILLLSDRRLWVDRSLTYSAGYQRKRRLRRRSCRML